MRRYLLIPLLGAIALFQASGMPPILVKPDLVLIAVVSWGIVAGARQALIGALLGGALIDLFSAAPFGISILAFVPAVIIVALGEQGVIESQSTVAAIGAFLGTVLYCIVFLFVLQTMGRRVDWYGTVVWTTLPAAGLNALLAFPGLWVSRRFMQTT